MTIPPRTENLSHLLQIDSFQNSIRTFFYKLSENRLTILAYTVVGILALIIIFRILARKK
jgi:hypothetical protein